MYSHSPITLDVHSFCSVFLFYAPHISFPIYVHLAKMKKPNNKSPSQKPNIPSVANSTKSTTFTLSSLRQEQPDLWYRIRILLYDLGNVAKDPLSEKRLSSTTNELYISAPYFSEDEAISIRTALIDNHDAENADHSDNDSAGEGQLTVENAIHQRLTGFLDKRKASGDARPCGPHDMIPVYGDVFGISKEELRDERFLSRLRRSGLGDSCAKSEMVEEGKGDKLGNAGRERKGKKP